jgi:hypothetical protein
MNRIKIVGQIVNMSLSEIARFKMSMKWQGNG